ncbi:hypothetical protein [Streptomyces chrestomyceticus]|uniref:hypothetical protein n=1 Tax=Streptomyces chrestomyceticus TaxID=68185 RepID=UPI0035A88841
MNWNRKASILALLIACALLGLLLAIFGVGKWTALAVALIVIAVITALLVPRIVNDRRRR